jgi:hypothetical protein
MKKLFIPLTFISIASIVSILFTPVFAHHSDAGYDEKNILSIQGVVVRYVWRNPHVTTYVKVEQENGETVEWAIETGSTPIMSRSGWTTDMLKPGDVISVRAHPDRNPDRKFAMMISTETADGKLWIQDESDYVGSDFTSWPFYGAAYKDTANRRRCSSESQLQLRYRQPHRSVHITANAAHINGNRGIPN